MASGARDSAPLNSLPEFGCVSGNLVKRDFEPFGIKFRMLPDVFGNGIRTHVFPFFHFFRVDCRLGVADADEHMVKFVFGKALPDGCLVDERKDFMKVAT